MRFSLSVEAEEDIIGIAEQGIRMFGPPRLGVTTMTCSLCLI